MRTFSVKGSGSNDTYRNCLYILQTQGFQPSRGGFHFRHTTVVPALDSVDFVRHGKRLRWGRQVQVTVRLGDNFQINFAVSSASISLEAAWTSKLINMMTAYYGVSIIGSTYSHTL